MNPARDLRGANGRPKKLRGSAFVFFPQRRPNVEALVSAQDSLVGSVSGGHLRINGGIVYMRTETTAISKGKSTRTNTTPRIYQTTPFVDFLRK